MSSEVVRVWILAALATGVASCSQPKGEVFPPLATPLRWPSPPAAARIEYVGQLATDQDLASGRSFGELLFGDEATRSMLSPYAVCTDGGERIFVSDSNGQVIHVFHLQSRRYETWPSGGEEPALAQPLGIAWDGPTGGGGRLLVADAAAGRIVILDETGRAQGVVGEAELQRPTGVAVDPATRRIFVADAAAHQVLVLGPDGDLRQRVGERGVEPGRFNFPTNVALDSSGRLYVADSLNFRVQVFSPSLEPIRQVGSMGDRPGYFSQPKGIAVDAADRLYVVDAHFEAVQIFDDTGRLLLSFGREGRDAGAFWLPAGIHVEPSGRLWVADTYNRRVQVFRILE